MQKLDRRAWFTAASNSLELIERNRIEYENDERIAPSTEIIEAVRTFLAMLIEAIPESKSVADVKLNVSVNGHIVATLGSAPQSLNIRFAPKISYLFKHPRLQTRKGKSANEAVSIVSEYFLQI